VKTSPGLAGRMRTFLAIAAGVLALAWLCGARGGFAAERRPNILLVEVDSMDGRVMGCMGHPAMARATPNLDALAKRGVLFRNAYTNNPICCPSRASMWSGKYTFHCEGWNNYKGLEPGTPTFRDELEKAGYLTQTFGKLDYLSGAHSTRARVTAWLRSANIERPQYRIGPPEVIDEDLVRVHAGDWKTADRAVAWIRENAKVEKPFFLYVGLNLPHPAFRTSQHYLQMIDEAGVTVPPADQYDHPVMRYQRLVKNWEHGYSDEMVRLVRRVYFAMIAETDAIVGHILSALRESGLTESTYVIFISDHGENAMEHRLWYKMNHYESSARVPMIVAGPDVRQGVVGDTLVSLIDIYPTLMDMARWQKPRDLDGHSLMPELLGQPGTRPDWVFSEYHDTACNTGSFMVRRGPWKYIAYPGYEPMLFNLDKDPDEIRNLASQIPDKVQEMDQLLRSIVDYEAVDAKVKAYDRASFAAWREEMKKQGKYEEEMARIFSGYDGVNAKTAKTWTPEDEAQVERWLKGKS